MTRRWSYSRLLFRQGAYLLIGAEGREIAAIVAADDAKPIHAPQANARLLVRDCHSNDWQAAGRFTFAEAVRRGNAHAKRCLLSTFGAASHRPVPEP